VWRKLPEVAQLEDPCLNWLSFGLQVTITFSETVQNIPWEGVGGIQSWNASWGTTQSMIIRKCAACICRVEGGSTKLQ